MSAWFHKGKYQVFSNSVALTSDPIKCALLRSGTLNATHAVFNDVGGTEVTGGGYGRLTLTTPTITPDTGLAVPYFDAADLTYTSVATGQSGIDNAVTIDAVADNDATDPLLWYHNWTEVHGNGGDITIQWNASGIARIT